jgi:hypothetical protein
VSEPSDFGRTADAFVAMAHRIVWCTAATVDRWNRPRTRILHPYWTREDGTLVGWVATGPTPVKRADLEHSPHLSCGYWSPDHDTCAADCRAEWFFDDETRVRVWDMFKRAPAPVGYDPAIIPVWKDGPRAPEFAALRLEPFRLRVFPGTALTSGVGEILTWSA